MLSAVTQRLWSDALSQLSIPEAEASGQTGSAAAAQPSNPGDPAPRRMQDSYCEIILPFASSPELLEKYTNATGGIRTGLLMEHLDSLAGSIAYKHMLGPEVKELPSNAGFYIVTASVDRCLDMLATLYPVRDMRLSGQVIHTGRSSMEVADGTETTVMVGRFCMVARDSKTQKAKLVNSLTLETSEDCTLFNMGESDPQNKRQSMAVHSLDRVPPTSWESENLHSLYLKYGSHTSAPSLQHKDKDTVWMGDTRLEKTMVMFPQERNVHKKIFGGYLMRLAYELGFANSCLFTRGHVTFLSLDGIAFARPVPIGSLLCLTSNIHVCVHADVVNLATGTEQRTNDFRFTWCRESGPALNRIVVPKTYGEAMQWIEGRRALEMGSEIRKLRKRT
ncbi:Thioesterase/thiol ester dehydrase-isomerase [Epithele typhae]|uniref:Thioesterase/thiol ester dehydrase-isomerase n=1 Tax=Epithele typhae TaxID=378194 RepID=UPI002008AA24|nr:Thioesterase/thiol ester dehydrase-isomerase [Epithele typhae]KAH9922303.1 Thioesterase/thiol ester dehydrase-isomerase [Epithele typhae]